jgi:hypothetical protein
MNQDPIDLAQYRQGRKKLPGPSGQTIRACLSGEVPCGKCRQPVSSRAQKCPNCKVHFSGFAADFDPSRPRPFAYKATAAVLIVATLLGALGLFA